MELTLALRIPRKLAHSTEYTKAQVAARFPPPIDIDHLDITADSDEGLVILYTITPADITQAADAIATFFPDTNQPSPDPIT